MKSLFCLILTVLLLFTSCSPREEVPEISMPATPIMTGTTSWGVVNVSYLKINKEPDNDQHIVTTLRKGDLVRIESIHHISEGQDSTIWYNIKKENLRGWVKDGSLDSYSTREKARTAAKRLLGESR